MTEVEILYDEGPDAKVECDATEGLSPAEVEDRRRCRLVEDALFRRARGYVKRLKKSVKVKRVEYDPETGKKLCEREELETGIEEEHIPADLRVCAYYLNNRDPERWREHPESAAESLGGVVDYPAMEEPTAPPHTPAYDEGDRDSSEAGEA